MGPICSFETSVLKQLTQRNDPEDVRTQFNRGESLRSRDISKLNMYIYVHVRGTVTDFLLKVEVL